MILNYNPSREGVGNNFTFSYNFFHYSPCFFVDHLDIYLSYLCNNFFSVRSVKIDAKDPICVNPTLLFTRLVALAQREEDIEPNFDFELTKYPMSLFKDNLMRKPDKSSLRKVFLPENSKHPAEVASSKYVLDGGALLHRVHWVKGMKFKEVGKAYVDYVRRNYGSTYIIFDGYDDSTSIKSNEHMRRTGSKGSAQNVIIRDENEVPYSKERFLSNTNNKTELIALLSEYLTKDNQDVYICNGDAYTKIVATCLEIAKDVPVVVVADDTDVAVMLLYHWSEDIHEVFFLQERGKKCWSIREAQLELIDVKENLLFIHAWSGCDSTSAILGKGKPSFYNLVKKSSVMQGISDTISDYWATRTEVGQASVKAFIQLYGGKSESLRQLRLVCSQ